MTTTKPSEREMQNVLIKSQAKAVAGHLAPLPPAVALEVARIVLAALLITHIKPDKRQAMLIKISAEIKKQLKAAK